MNEDPVKITEFFVKFLCKNPLNNGARNNQDVKDVSWKIRVLSILFCECQYLRSMSASRDQTGIVTIMVNNLRSMRI